MHIRADIFCPLPRGLIIRAEDWLPTGAERIHRRSAPAHVKPTRSVKKKTDFAFGESVASY